MLANKSNYVFLTVRTSSTRLPRKCFLPFGDSTVLGHVISRAQYFDLIPVVCTSDVASDDEIENVCKNMGVAYFRGSLDNKLLRWYECAKFFSISSFHTVDVDDPFFDPNQVIESLNRLDDKDLDYVSPTKNSASGGASVGYSIQTRYLESILSSFSDLLEVEMVDVIFSKDSSSRNEVLVSKFDEIDSVRMTLDYPEDYWLLLFVMRLCGPFSQRKEIIELFKINPDLYKLNWFRNSEWALNQSRIRIETQSRN